MVVKLIWAQARDTQGRPVIGMNGHIPWHAPEDLAHFKQTTLGHPVIMGRKTWDSLPAQFRPLPGRMNVVISSQASTRQLLQRSGAEAAQSLTEAINACNRPGIDEVWVMGGAQIYEQALALAQQVVVTEVDAVFEGDAFAPHLNNNWRETKRLTQTSAKGLRLSFVTYMRR